MTAQPYQPAPDRQAIDEDEADVHATDEDEGGSRDAVSSSYKPAHSIGSGASQFGTSPPPAADPDLVVLPEDAAVRPDAGPEDAEGPEDAVTGPVVASSVVEADAVDDSATEDDLTGGDHLTDSSGASDDVSDDYPHTGEPGEAATREADLDRARTTAALLTTSPLTANPVGENAATGSQLPADVPSTDLGEPWHDIQVMFVDDPPGSVQRAAAAADAAVSSLAELLRERQAALSPAGGDIADTEQLRETLRSYRTLCQNLAEVGSQLQQSRP